MVLKLYYKAIIIVFGTIVIVHLARITGEWDAVINGAPVPMWASWAAVFIAGYLAVRGIQLSDECNGKK
ncbi:MAG: hypothetical protein WD335_03800 [Candidatus Paceibacterota bacterium]